MKPDALFPVLISEIHTEKFTFGLYLLEIVSNSSKEINVKLIIRLLINAVALWAAAQFVDGIHLTGEFGGILIVALIFGLINAIIGPILKILSLPFILVTLGLFTLVINGLLLWLTASLSSNLSISGFWAAFWGALVVSIVSWILSAVLKDDDNKKKDR
ncbi:MAG: phage holin family protein [Chloroflexi bacterium]|nr:phage holin family protein [Chloroflexota bacterium]